MHDAAGRAAEALCAAGGVTDLAGNGLASVFNRPMNVLPGDANGSDNVSNADVGLTNFRGFTSFGGGPNSLGFVYDAFYDVNSTANISSADVGLTNLQGFDELPPPPAALPLQTGGEAEGIDDWASLVDQAFGNYLF